MTQVPATRRPQGGRMATRREHPLDRLHQDFDALFARLLGGWAGPFEQEADILRVWDFSVNENDKEIVVRAELPGFEENEIDVQLHNNVLTIKAEKEQKGEGREEYRTFFRSITLPTGINPEKVQATYRNGVLELHIPRAEGAQPRRIQVEGQNQGQQAATGQQAQPTASAKGQTSADKGQTASDKGQTASDKGQTSSAKAAK